MAPGVTVKPLSVCCTSCLHFSINTSLSWYDVTILFVTEQNYSVIYHIFDMQQPAHFRKFLIKSKDSVAVFKLSLTMFYVPQARIQGVGFVKIHAPWNALCREAELMKLKMPTKKVRLSGYFQIAHFSLFVLLLPLQMTYCCLQYAYNWDILLCLDSAP